MHIFSAALAVFALAGVNDEAAGNDPPHNGVSVRKFHPNWIMDCWKVNVVHLQTIFFGNLLRLDILRGGLQCENKIYCNIRVAGAR